MIAMFLCAKRNGIALLTFPPHCSRKLQPLDRSVYGTLKKFYNTACDSWMLENPGKPMTIYDMAGRVGRAFPLAMTHTNILAGFRVSGNYPFNRDIFTDDEFLSSYVTDRPISVPVPESISEVGEPQIASATSVEVTNSSGSAPPPPVIGTSTVTSVSCVGALSPTPVVSDAVSATGAASSTILPTHSVLASPEPVKPHPKASERKSTHQRKKGKSQVLTDTPVKMELEKQALMKKQESGQKQKSGQAQKLRQNLKCVRSN